MKSWEGAWSGQLTKVAKGTFCVTEHHTQYIKWGELPGKGVSQLRDLSLVRGGEQLYCASLVFLGIYLPPSHSFLLQLLVLVSLPLFFTLFLLFNCSYLNQKFDFLFFSDSPHHVHQWEEGEVTKQLCGT